jgi:hypothetical protein
VEDDEDLVSLMDATLAGRAEIVAAQSLQEAERLDVVDRISSLVNHSVPIILLATDNPPKTNGNVAVVLVKSQVFLTEATATFCPICRRTAPEAAHH